MLHRLYRALHTLKGNSALLNLTQIESLAHASEDMIGLVRDQGAALDPAMIELMLALLDRLRAVTEFASTEHRDVPADQVRDLVDRVHQWSASRGLRRETQLLGATRGEILIWSDIPTSDDASAVHPLEDMPSEAKDADSVEMFPSLCREMLPNLQHALPGSTAASASEEKPDRSRLADDLAASAERMQYPRLVDALRTLGRASEEREAQQRFVDVCSELVHVEDAGVNAAGCLLTGMGADGAAGLLRMRGAGACTLAQDRETSAVWGMPAAAHELGAAERFVPLFDFPSVLLRWASARSSLSSQG